MAERIFRKGDLIVNITPGFPHLRGVAAGKLYRFVAEPGYYLDFHVEPVIKSFGLGFVMAPSSELKARVADPKFDQSVFSHGDVQEVRYWNSLFFRYDPYSNSRHTRWNIVLQDGQAREFYDFLSEESGRFPSFLVGDDIEAMNLKYPGMVQVDEGMMEVLHRRWVQILFPYDERYMTGDSLARWASDINTFVGVQRTAQCHRFIGSWCRFDSADFNKMYLKEGLYRYLQEKWEEDNRWTY